MPLSVLEEVLNFNGHYIGIEKISVYSSSYKTDKICKLYFKISF